MQWQNHSFFKVVADSNFFKTKLLNKRKRAGKYTLILVTWVRCFVIQNLSRHIPSNRELSIIPTLNYREYGSVKSIF